LKPSAGLDRWIVRPKGPSLGLVRGWHDRLFCFTKLMRLSIRANTHRLVREIEIVEGDAEDRPQLCDRRHVRV